MSVGQLEVGSPIGKHLNKMRIGPPEPHQLDVRQRLMAVDIDVYYSWVCPSFYYLGSCTFFCIFFQNILEVLLYLFVHSYVEVCIKIEGTCTPSTSKSCNIISTE